MIDMKTAIAAVEAFICNLPQSDDNDPRVVVPEKTEDYGFAWVVHWTVRSLLERKRNPPITGNYPIIVRKDDGEMFVCAGPYPPQYFLNLLQSNPDAMAGKRIQRPDDQTGRMI